MNFKKISSILVLFLFISMTFGQTAMAMSNSDRGLIVDLLNQNPDPVKPGDVLEVRFSIQNTRSSATENVIVEIVTKYPFSKSKRRL